MGIGTGIYPSMALLNHSCNQNIAKYFDGSTLIAMAARNIFKGEEVTENYFPVFTHMPREDRKEFLSTHYCFDCNCLACEKNYPMLSVMKNSTALSWRCFDCHGYYENGICLDCKNKMNVEDMVKKFDKLKESIDKTKMN